MTYGLILQRCTSCVVPQREAPDFSWKKYSLDLCLTIAWLVFTAVGGFLFFFGTVLDQTNYSSEPVKAELLSMLQKAILDF